MSICACSSVCAWVFSAIVNVLLAGWAFPSNGALATEVSDQVSADTVVLAWCISAIVNVDHGSPWSSPIASN
jgi:hypothetical protein